MNPSDQPTVLCRARLVEGSEPEEFVIQILQAQPDYWETEKARSEADTKTRLLELVASDQRKIHQMIVWGRQNPFELDLTTPTNLP